MRVVLPKQMVLDALARERVFTARTWVDVPTPRATVRSRQCSVCAVGAVVRRALAPGQPARAIGDVAANACDEGYGLAPSARDAEDSAAWLAEDDQWLSAISCIYETAARSARYFEGKARQAQLRGAADVARAWAAEHLPPAIVVDVGDWRPAPGLAVLPGGEWRVRR